MAKDNKIITYYYFNEPTKDKYTIGDDRTPIKEFTINDCKIKIYINEESLIEMLRIDIINPDRESDFIANYLKNYVQSLLRLSYSGNFKFSRFVMKHTGEFNNGEEIPRVNSGNIKLEHANNKPQFNEHFFNVILPIFAEKTLQIELLANNLDDIDNPLDTYANLYKIIEFEFHPSEERGAKKSLKTSGFKNITEKFNFEGKTGEDLIDYIVDLRDKCNHLKKKGTGLKYGFSLSNINDKKEVQKFLPIMRKICAQAINPGFEILNKN